MKILDRLLGRDNERLMIPWRDNNTEELACPVCGFQYIHLKETRKEDFRGRGGCLMIPMYCENGHQWDLAFDAHKGQINISVENIKDDEEEDYEEKVLRKAAEEIFS